MRWNVILYIQFYIEIDRNRFISLYILNTRNKRIKNVKTKKETNVLLTQLNNF